MSVQQKFAAFALGLVGAFAVGYGVGGAVDPIVGDDDPAPRHEEHQQEDAP